MHNIHDPQDLSSAENHAFQIGLDAAATAQYIRSLIDAPEDIPIKYLQAFEMLQSIIVLFDKTTKRAGTVDLITYDQQGAVRIFDIKTMLYDPSTGTNYDSTAVFEPVVGVLKSDGSQKFVKVKGAQDSSRIKHQKQLSAYRIILNNTHGILAEELFVVPIKVDYKGGDKVANSAEFLKSIKILPLNKVGNLVLDTTKTVEVAQPAQPATVVTPKGTVIRKNNMTGLGQKITTKPPAKVKTPDNSTESTQKDPYLEMLVDDYSVSQQDISKIKDALDLTEIKRLVDTMNLLTTSDPMFDQEAFMQKFMADKGIPAFKLAKKDAISSTSWGSLPDGLRSSLKIGFEAFTFTSRKNSSTGSGLV